MEGQGPASEIHRRCEQGFQEACLCVQTYEVWEGEARTHAMKSADGLVEIFANFQA